VLSLGWTDWENIEEAMEFTQELKLAASLEPEHLWTTEAMAILHISEALHTYMYLPAAKQSFLPVSNTLQFERCFENFCYLAWSSVLQTAMEFGFDDEPKHHKSPYFSLADPALLKPLLDAIVHASTIEAPKHKRHCVIYKSLKDIFGELSKMSDENQAKFLLAVLKNGSFEPDWKATAKDLGTMNGHNM
jgi:hypothetical protein